LQPATDREVVARAARSGNYRASGPASSMIDVCTPGGSLLAVWTA